MHLTLLSPYERTPLQSAYETNILDQESNLSPLDQTSIALLVMPPCGLLKSINTNFYFEKNILKPLLVLLFISMFISVYVDIHNTIINFPAF